MNPPVKPERIPVPTTTCLLWWRSDCPTVLESDADRLLSEIGLEKSECDEAGQPFSKPEFLESDIRSHEDKIMQSLQRLATADYLSNLAREKQAAVDKNNASYEDWREAMFRHHVGSNDPKGSTVADLRSDASGVTTRGGTFIAGVFHHVKPDAHTKHDAALKGTRWER